MQLPKKLLPILTAKQRNIVLIGGRGGAKSVSVTDKCLMDCQTQGIHTACFREFQNSIDDSVHSLLTSEVERLGLQGFDCQEKQILYNGQKAFRYRGMFRNVEGIKGMVQYRRFWVEEAQTSSQKSITTIKNTLRTPGSQIYWTANPKSAADPFSQRFIVPYQKQIRRDGYYADDMDLVILINYMDNPFFPPELEQERLYDLEHMTEAEYRHVWHGEFYDEVENSIIPVKWFDAAIDAHLKLGFKPEGQKVVAHDPSDEGDDDKAVALRHGVVITDVRSNDSGDINDGCEWAIDFTESVNADHFIWDADGMGIALKRDVSKAFHGRKITWDTFHGQGTVDHPDRKYVLPEEEGKPLDDIARRKQKTNREVFKNKRAQYWWALRDRFYRTYEAVEKGKYTDPDLLISLSSGIKEMDQLRAEICRIPRKNNVLGKIQIMSKEEMAALPEPIASPNMGDACMMLMCTPPVGVQSLKLRSSSPW